MKIKADPPDLSEVKITGGFWHGFVEKAINLVIPYQWEALNDRIEDAEPSFCMRNFRVASGKEKGQFGGRVFQDSDIAKWLEAVAYSLMLRPDPELEKTADAAIDDIVAAQQPDGYLNTYYIITGRDKRFTNLMDNHELYCLGHFLEAAVAYFRATKKDKLLKAFIKYVDLINTLIGPEDGKIHGYPGHQEIELALVKLYEITRDEKHLKLAKYFIDERGKKPNFFREEAKKHDNSFYWKDSLFQHGYSQAAEPVRQQQHAVGHSVRAVYMYTGMADIARETDDSELMQACRRLWTDITRRQMYVTGGIGSSQYGEAFTFGYDLPNHTMYTETCASIGLVFFAQRMLNVHLDSEYADVMEQALYNGIISGMSVDGKSFFYVNPLEVFPEASEKDQLREHVKPERQKWFGTSCCPPNLARILTSLGAYTCSKIGDCLYLHLYTGGEVSTELDSGRIKLDVSTNYPWDGDVSVTVNEAPAQSAVALRVPGWCESYTLAINGAKVDAHLKGGYLHIEGICAGDAIQFTMEMPVVVLEANPNVRADIGKVAIRRGPMVFCIEEVDNGSDLHKIFLQKNAEFTSVYDENFLGGAVILKSCALRLKAWNSDELYRKSQPAQYENIELKWVPYYLWANRGKGEMCCWINVLE